MVDGINPQIVSEIKQPGSEHTDDLRNMITNIKKSAVNRKKIAPEGSSRETKLEVVYEFRKWILTIRSIISETLVDLNDSRDTLGEDIFNHTLSQIESELDHLDTIMSANIMNRIYGPLPDMEVDEKYATSECPELVLETLKTLSKDLENLSKTLR